METKIVSDVVNGISLTFKDLKSSGTVECVFAELSRNDYGLESIQLSENDVVLDVGANVGMFSIYVKKKFNCRVISFEPVSLNFNHFKENILLNGLSLEDFEIHNVAITSKDNDVINIGTPHYNTGGSSIFHTCENVQQCNTQTLDKYITDDCKYIKIDTEGGEYDIIPSIIDRISNVSYIGIEYHKYNSSQNPETLHNLLLSRFKGTIFCELPK